MELEIPLVNTNVSLGLAIGDDFQFQSFTLARSTIRHGPQVGIWDYLFCRYSLISTHYPHLSAIKMFLACYASKPILPTLGNPQDLAGIDQIRVVNAIVPGNRLKRGAVASSNGTESVSLLDNNGVSVTARSGARA